MKLRIMQFPLTSYYIFSFRSKYSPQYLNLRLAQYAICSPLRIIYIYLADILDKVEDLLFHHFENQNVDIDLSKNL